MTIEKMISELDTVAGMLIVSAMQNKTVMEAMQKVAAVSIALGEMAEEMENNCEEEK